MINRDVTASVSKVLCEAENGFEKAKSDMLSHSDDWLTLREKRAYLRCIEEVLADMHEFRRALMERFSMKMSKD